MTILKRTLLIVAVLGGFAAAAAPQADAGVFYRRAPVRRVAARAVLPPYPIARRAVFRPVVRPVRAVGFGPGFHGPGVSVGIGIY